MKNILKKSLAVLLFLTISAVPVFAQSSAPAADTILPGDIDVYYQVSTSVRNPIEEFAIEGIQAALEGETNAPAMIEILERVIADNTATVAMKMNFTESSDGVNFIQNPDMYITFMMTTEDYQALSDLDDDNPVAHSYGSQTVYSTGSDMFYTILNGLFVMTSNEVNMHKAIDRFNSYSHDSLSESTTYQGVKSHFLNDGFLNIYVNPQIAGEISSMSAADPQLTFFALENSVLHKQLFDALLAEGISISQETNGFGFSGAVEADLAKLRALSLSFDDYNTVPSLYQTLNGDNLIYYEEKANITRRFQDMFRELNLSDEDLEAYEDWKTEFKTKSGIDFDTEILPLFQNNFMATIHKTGQIWPGVTFVVELGDHKSLGQTTLAKFIKYLKKEAALIPHPEHVTFSTYVSDNNGTFNLITINVKDAGDGFENLSHEEADLKISMGVTGDGKLIISNVPDLDSLLVGSLTNNDEFDDAFINKPETVETVGYFSFDQLQSYANQLMQAFDAEDEVSELVNGLLDPWNYLFVKTYADNNTGWVKGFINVDVEGLYNYVELLEEAFTRAAESGVVLPSREFCDVHSNDWFYQYVQQLQSLGIVSGYEDGCFRPGQFVTRAEFLKMVIKARQTMGYVFGVHAMGDETTPDPSLAYSDVDQNAWYKDYVDMALAHKIAKGYPDGTFRPNANITRAEAVQMLINIAPYLTDDVGIGPETDLPFTDVHSYDWFFSPVETSYAYGIVKGTTATTFEPGRNLNRAEAAKIISIFRPL